MQAVNVYGVKEYDLNYILNIDFLKKFHIDIFCTSYNNIPTSMQISEGNESIANNIIYGVKIGYNEIKEGINKSNKIILSKFSRYVLNNFKKEFKSPFITTAFYNIKIDKKDFNFDFTYDKYKNKLIKEYSITCNLYIKYCRYNENGILKIKEIIKFYTLKYNYEFISFNINKDSDKDIYYLNILIKIIDNKKDKWIEQIINDTKKYTTFNDLKIKLINEEI